MYDNSPEAKKERKAEWLIKDALCRNCKKNNKRHGSSYCQSCSDNHKGLISTEVTNKEK